MKKKNLKGVRELQVKMITKGKYYSYKQLASKVGLKSAIVANCDIVLPGLEPFW